MKQLILATRFVAQNYRGCKHPREAQPYITHALDVVYVLNTFAHVENEEILVAAVLHDILSQKNISIQEVKQAFGAQVADIVQSCDQYNTLCLKATKQEGIDHLISLHPAAQLIILAHACASLSDAILCDNSGIRISNDTCLFHLPGPECTSFFEQVDMIIQALPNVCHPLVKYAQCLLSESKSYFEIKKLPVVDQVASH